MALPLRTARKALALAAPQRMASTAAGHSHEGGMKLWKNFSIFLAVPCVAVMTVYNVLLMQQAAEHGGHERPEFVNYEHMRIRNKRFPWGDGQKSLFHNPHVNPVPNVGYEDHH